MINLRIVRKRVNSFLRKLKLRLRPYNKYRAFSFPIGLIIFCLIYYFYQNATESDGKRAVHIILSSGVTGGTYYRNANYIKNVLDSVIKPSSIDNIPSSGSFENFDRLISKQADIIIAQRNVVIDKYYQKDDAFKNFEIIMPLFTEALQIIVHDISTKQVIDYTEFERRIKDKRIRKIEIGPKGSVTNKITRDIISCINDSVTISSSLFFEDPIDIAIENFETDSSCCLIDFAAPPFQKFENKGNQLSIVSFKHDQLIKLISFFKDYDTIKFNSSIYFNTSPYNEDIHTIGTCAFLLATPSVYRLLPSHSRELGDIIIADIIKKNPDNNIAQYYEKELKLKKNKTGFEIDSAERLRSDVFFEGIPVSNTVSNLYNIGGISNMWRLAELIMLLLILSYILYEINNIILIGRAWALWKIKPIRFSYPFLRFKYLYGHWLPVIAFALIILLIFSGFIQLFETRNYQLYGIKSPMLNLGLLDTMEWLIVYIWTHHEGSVFPISAGGKIITTISFFIEGGILIVPLIIQYFITLRIKKRMTGRETVDAKNNFVICGWNERTYDLANNLLEIENKYSNDSSSNIILLNTVLEDIENDEKNENFKGDCLSNSIQFRRGSPTNIEDLDAINISEARAVIIIAEGKGRESDEKVLLTAHTISTHYKKSKSVNKADIYMIAEVSDPSASFHNHLIEADVNVVISTGEIVHDLILQDTVCNGIYNAIRGLIKYDDATNSENSNDFYSVQVKDYPNQLLDHTFDELHPRLRRQKIQLIGFKKRFLDKSDNKIIIDHEEIQKRLKDKNLKSEYIINPQTESENNEKTELNDEIIVLSLDKESLKKIKLL